VQPDGLDTYLNKYALIVRVHYGTLLQGGDGAPLLGVPKGSCNQFSCTPLPVPALGLALGITGAGRAWALAAPVLGAPATFGRLV
jgi:hypothetical protein